MSHNFSLNPILKKNTHLIKAYASNDISTKSKNKIRSSWVINKSDFEADQMDEEFFGEIIVLDDFFENLDNLNLLKIDVDGFDYKVLQGCRNLILDHKPIIFIELGEKDLNKNGDSVVDIVNFFDEVNYSGVLENGELIESDKKLISDLQTVTHINGIFSSKSKHRRDWFFYYAP